MDDQQIINKDDSVPDIIFDPSSYEMDEKEMLNQIWKTHFLDFTTKGNGGAYATKSQQAMHASTLQLNRSYTVYNSTQDTNNPLQWYSNTNTKDYIVDYVTTSISEEMVSKLFQGFVKLCV